MKRLLFFFLFVIAAFAQSTKPKFDPCGGAASCIPPKPEWVADPSAGHYDCPDGWTAYKAEEPRKFFTGPIAAIYRAPTLDKKGHVLDDRPSPGICIQDLK
jgi:hypothetical protein